LSRLSLLVHFSICQSLIAEQIAAFEQDRANVAAKLAEVTSAMEGESTALARLTEELEANRQQIEQRQRAFDRWAASVGVDQ